MKLSLYLKSHQIGVADFAVLVGASPFAVKKWLRGERTPRDIFMRRIMLATEGEVTPNDFLSLPENHRGAA